LSFELNHAGTLMISSHTQSYPYFSAGCINFARLATGLCRQAQTRDDKASAWTRIPCPTSYSYSTYHIHPHTTWPTPPPFFTPFLDCTYPPPSISPLSAEDDDAKLDIYKAISEDTYQSGVELNEYNSSRMVIFSCGTTNAHGCYVQWVE
jgi:hypothetical protein